MTTLETGVYDPRRPNPAHRAFFDWLENYLRQQQITDAELWQALEKKLWPYRHPILYRLGEMAHPVKQYRSFLNSRVRQAGD